MTETKPGQIVALGGGGFSMRAGYTAIDHFILGLARRERSRVCFVPTASADSATYITKFYRAFGNRCTSTDLPLCDPPALPRQPARTTDPAEFVSARDVFSADAGYTAPPLPLG